MGTEIFPQILFFAKCVVGTIGAIAIITIIAALVEQYAHRSNEKHKEQMKEHIVTALITITIALIAYFLLSGVGPVFDLLFNRA